MTETKLRPICQQSSKDKELFEHLRDERVVMEIAKKFAAMVETTPEDIRKQYYIECDKPTPRGKAEALLRIIAYHLDMNVVDVSVLILWNSFNAYTSLMKFAAKLPCANRKAKGSEDIDTTVHGLVADCLDGMLSVLDKTIDTVCNDRTTHHEDEEN